MDAPSRCATVDAPLSGGASTRRVELSLVPGAHGFVRAPRRGGARRTPTGWSTLARSSRGTRSSLVVPSLIKWQPGAPGSLRSERRRSRGRESLRFWLPLPLGGQPVRFRVAGVHADRCVCRPPLWPDGSPPHPPRDLLRVGARRAVHVARFESGPGRSMATSGISSITSTTAPTSTWNCSSVPELAHLVCAGSDLLVMPEHV